MAGGMLDKIKKMLSIDDGIEEELSEDSSSEAVSAEVAPNNAWRRQASSNRANLVALPNAKQPHKMEIVIFQEYQLTNMADVLRENKCLIVDMTTFDNSNRQRSCDFLSGFAYACRYTTTKIFDNIYIYTPESVVTRRSVKTMENEEIDEANVPEEYVAPEPRPTYSGPYRR